jgi:hypothetical protein
MRSSQSRTSFGTHKVADCFSERGYAFVEDDKIETLAAVLRTFLTVTRIPVHEDGGSSPLDSGAEPIAFTPGR